MSVSAALQCIWWVHSVKCPSKAGVVWKRGKERRRGEERDREESIRGEESWKEERGGIMGERG